MTGADIFLIATVLAAIVGSAKIAANVTASPQCVASRHTLTGAYARGKRSMRDGLRLTAEEDHAVATAFEGRNRAEPVRAARTWDRRATLTEAQRSAWRADRWGSIRQRETDVDEYTRYAEQIAAREHSQSAPSPTHARVGQGRD